MVHMPGTVKGKAWKFARAFYGPYRVVALTSTNAEVRLVDKPEENTIFVALEWLRPCPGELKNVSWHQACSAVKENEVNACSLSDRAAATLHWSHDTFAYPISMNCNSSWNVCCLCEFLCIKA